MAGKLIDYKEALDRLGGDEEFLTELLHELLVQIDQNFSQIKRAIETKNYEELKMLSHSLKGASANLNVNRIANHFLNLEELGTTSSIDGANEILDLVFEDRNELEVFLNQN
jgi:HPt (histidine-containing phosphotransfer) domain-containing protein